MPAFSAYAASQVFTPGAPISRKDCFSGRSAELQRIMEAISAPGRHPVIFGQRGVGKTSLANIVGELSTAGIAAKVSCDGSDTFRSIWTRLLRDASYEFKMQAFGFNRHEVVSKVSLADFLGVEVEDVTPAEVCRVLSMVRGLAIFILDEFDKVTEPKTRSQMADLIKAVSDSIHHVTIITVGVAEDINQLIGNHPSVERNLAQIELPTMSPDEISAIVTNGWDKLKLPYAADIPGQVVFLSNGYPLRSSLGAERRLGVLPQ